MEVVVGDDEVGFVVVLHLVGIRVGTLVGLSLCSSEGRVFGNLDGDSVGALDGFTLGLEVGVLDGIVGGNVVGDNVGILY